MRIEAIAKIISAQVLSKAVNHDIRVLNFDSRKSIGNESELFIALHGTKNDGHNYIRQLYEAGIRNFLVSKKIDAKQFPQSNILQVANTRIALQQIARVHREKYSIPIVGITGSNGKTIVKEWLTSLLLEKYQVIKSPKSYNSQLGVPLSLWQISDSHQVGVFEAGISKPHEMEALANIIQPTIGIFTNLGEAHDEGFKDKAEKLVEKNKLFETAHTVICCYEHNDIREKLGQKAYSWSYKNEQADLFYQKDSSSYSVRFDGRKYAFKIPFSSKYDLENIFHAVSLALQLNLSQDQIQTAIDKIKPVPMRLELKRGVNDTYILDDSYNNDFLGLSTALDYLLQQPRKDQKTVILSDILQSGKSPKELYSQVNELLINHNITHFIGIGPEIQKAQKSFTIPSTFYESTSAFLRATPTFSDELILVKGARDFNLDRIVTYLEEKSHGTVFEVNNEAIVQNLNTYRQQLSSGTKLMVMVKAFAYGVGVNEIAHLLQYHKVDYLGVAYLDEAIELRRKGIWLPIMIMNPDKASFPLFSAFDLEPEIYSLDMLRSLLSMADFPPGIHLKIETGMNRLGFSEKDISELSTLLKSNHDLEVKSIFTHFSSADDPREDMYTHEQATIFDRVYGHLSNSLGYEPLKHAVNSAGIVRWPQYHYDMARLGIGLYGFDSADKIRDLRPVGTLKTKVSQLKNVKKGATIGYSRKGVVEKDSTIATLAIGYADGYSRVFSNGNAYVLINGQKARTIGNVCMDMTMVDVTGLQVREGDEAIIFGEQPTIGDLADWANTIPYEILTNVSQRVKRVFVSE